jgi:hypothetical protein
MRNDQPALSALFACESGLSESEIGLEHDKWQNLHGVRSFMIAFIFPILPPCLQHFWENFFRCPFHTKSAPSKPVPPPPPFDASYAPEYQSGTNYRTLDKKNKDNKNNDMVNDNSLKSRTKENLFSTFKTKA